MLCFVCSKILTVATCAAVTLRYWGTLHTRSDPEEQRHAVLANCARADHHIGSHARDRWDPLLLPLLSQQALGSAVHQRTTASFVDAHRGGKIGEMRGRQMQALIRDNSTAVWPGSIFSEKAVSEAPVEPDPTPPDRWQPWSCVCAAVRLCTSACVSSLTPVAGWDAPIPTH